MSDDKNILDQFFDKADEVLDKAAVLRRIGTVEEEEAASNPPLVEWKFSQSSRMWHAFRVGTDETRCGREFSDEDVYEKTDNKNVTALVRSTPHQGTMSVMCCIVCMIRTVR